jgi:hypothetical protein
VSLRSEDGDRSFLQIAGNFQPNIGITSQKTSFFWLKKEPPRADSGPDPQKYFGPHSKGGPAWEKVRKQSKQRRKQDGRWPQRRATLQITA